MTTITLDRALRETIAATFAERGPRAVRALRRKFAKNGLGNMVRDAYSEPDYVRANSARVKAILRSCAATVAALPNGNIFDELGIETIAGAASPAPAAAPSKRFVSQHLDAFPESAALPHSLIRSALFSVKNKNEARQFIRRQTYALHDSAAVLTYTGVELRQDDADALLFLVSEAKCQKSGVVSFKPRPAVKAMGWCNHSSQVSRLLETLTRLQGAVVRVTQPDGSFASVQLVKRVDGHLKSGTTPWTAEVDSAIIELFNSGWSFISQYQRGLLPEGLARWLHAFYGTHSKPVPLEVEYIRQLSGSTAQPKAFRQMLKDAMTAVQGVKAIKGFAFGAGSKGEMLKIIW
jgi:hypothetical protein